MKFKVPDMACGACATKIKAALQSTVPQTQVITNLADKTVEVSGDLSEEAAKQVITAAGYTVAETL